MSEDPGTIIAVTLVLALAAIILCIGKWVLWDPRRPRRTDVNPQTFDRQFITTGIVAGVIVLLAIIIMSMVLQARIR